MVFAVMILDGASSHKAKDPQCPDSLALIALPLYASELNPREHVRDELREKVFPNRVFSYYAGAGRQLEYCLPRLSADRETTRSLIVRPSIISPNLNKIRN